MGSTFPSRTAINVVSEKNERIQSDSVLNLVKISHLSKSEKCSENVIYSRLPTLPLSFSLITILSNHRHELVHCMEPMVFRNPSKLSVVLAYILSRL